LFHVDGRKDIAELIVPFRNLANAPKNRRKSFLLKNKQWRTTVIIRVYRKETRKNKW